MRDNGGATPARVAVAAGCLASSRQRVRVLVRLQVGVVQVIHKQATEHCMGNFVFLLQI
jgi:hypothetical protein